MSNGLVDLFKVVTRLSAIGAKVSGIGATAFGIRQIWYKATEEQSWQSKVILSTLYAFHMGSISLTAAVLLGATDVTASLATAVVCSTALLKSLGDLLVEKTNYLGLERKHSDLEQQLIAKNSDFQTNLTLVEDLKETDDAIDALNLELKKYHQYLQQTRQKQTLDTLWQTLQQQEIVAVNKNKIIRHFFDKIDLEKFDPDSTIKSLLLKASQLTPGDHQQKLADIGIIQLQCIKYKRVLGILKEINLLLGSLPPGQSSAKSHYLVKRKVELENRLLKLQRGGFECLPEGFTLQHQTKTLAALKKPLQQFLKSKISELNQRLTEQQLLLVEKKEYLSRPIDFSPMVEHVQGISAMQNKLWFAKLSENTKSKNVDLGVASAVLALILAMLPSVEVTKFLNPVMLSIGVMAGVVSLRDLYRRFNATAQMSDNENRKMKQFILQKKFQISKLGDSNLRGILIGQLENILQEGKSTMPIISDQLVVNHARKAKLTAKKTLYQQVQDPSSPVVKLHTRLRASRR